ncbi:MAG TPA: hypothetical protein VER55_09760 [Ardenticatenaceae bacterium]|nr:hypothetical protein [Ardenticatenaceae bacterium]
MQRVSWGAVAFGMTLALCVALGANSERLALLAGFLVGIAPTLFLAACFLFARPGGRPRRHRIVEGRSRTIESDTTRMRRNDDTNGIALV